MSGTGARVANEFAKLRHLRIWLIAAALGLGQLVLTVLSTLSSAAFADPSTRTWNLPLAGLSLAVPLLSPLLLAVVASRMVEPEHHGNGWLLNQGTGTTPGSLCRAKLIAGAAVIGAVQVVTNLTLLLLGHAAGIDEPVPGRTWLGFAAAGLLINLVVFALQLLISAKVENQLVPLGIGALGTVVAVFASGVPGWLAQLTPWGHYARIAAAGYRDGQLTGLEPSFTGVAVLGCVAVALFTIITARFDRQEA